MPIYEFYCSPCRTLFSFFSSTVRPDAAPDCPRCRRGPLERRPSGFAMLSGTKEEETDGMGDLDDERMMQAFSSMASEIEGAEDTDDPRQMARLMRRFGEASGLELGAELEAMVERLEAGEDPDEVEKAFEHLDDADLDALFQVKRLKARAARPRIDPELYFL